MNALAAPPPHAMSIDRHQARVFAMQALCHYDAQGGRVADVLDLLTAEASLAEATVEYARALCEHYGRSKAAIDEKIGEVVQHWTVDRLGDVDRNVIRVAAVELIRKEVPPKVVVNEAIEIARQYGSAESPRFVNGVLDPLLKKSEQGELS